MASFLQLFYSTFLQIYGMGSLQKITVFVGQASPDIIRKIRPAIFPNLCFLLL